MLYMRGNPHDYDEWRARGCEGWGHADLLPYFKRAETSWRGASPSHGDAGPINVERAQPTDLDTDYAAAAQRLGFPVAHDLNIAEFEGVGPAELSIQRNGRRSSAALTYLYPALARPGLQLERRATVTRVILEGQVARGVEYLQDGTPRQARATREVVI